MRYAYGLLVASLFMNIMQFYKNWENSSQIDYMKICAASDKRDLQFYYKANNSMMEVVRRTQYDEDLEHRCPETYYFVQQWKKNITDCRYVGDD